MKEYTMPQRDINFVKFFLVVFILLLAFSLVYLFYLHDQRIDKPLWFYTALICIPILIYNIDCAWRFLLRLPTMNIAADDDGLWVIQVGKDKGLVPWQHIVNIKERSKHQHYELLGNHDTLLLSIDYGLTGFESLRSLLLDKTFHLIPADNRLSFSKSWRYHFFYLAALLGLFAIFVNVYSPHYHTFSFYLILALILYIAYQYLANAAGINIFHQHFEIRFPTYQRIVAFGDIEKIILLDTPTKSGKITEVQIICKKAHKTYELKNMGVDEHVLFQALRRHAHV